MIGIARTSGAALLAILALAAGVAMPAMAQEACVSNRDLQARIASGEVASAPDMLQANGYDLGEWKILGAPQLCPTGNGYAYEISIWNRTGEARSLTCHLPSGPCT